MKLSSSKRSNVPLIGFYRDGRMNDFHPVWAASGGPSNNSLSKRTRRKPRMFRPRCWACQPHCGRMRDLQHRMDSRASWVGEQRGAHNIRKLCNTNEYTSDRLGVIRLHRPVLFRSNQPRRNVPLNPLSGNFGSRWITPVLHLVFTIRTQSDSPGSAGCFAIARGKVTYMLIQVSLIPHLRDECL
jgi:hypothetical protein